MSKLCTHTQNQTRGYICILTQKKASIMKDKLLYILLFLGYVYFDKILTK